LGDPILVRDGLKMVLMSRAEELRSSLATILSEIERTLEPPMPFNPAIVQRTMRIATNDYGAFVLIPPLMKRLQQVAPGIDLEVWEVGRDVRAAIDEDKIDLVVTDAWTLRQYPCTEAIFSETFTCMVRQDHPRIQTELSLDRYLAENHVLVSPHGRVEGNVDAVLAQQGLQRRVRLTLPHVLAVPAAIAATDDLVTLASRIAHALAANHKLKLFPPPIALDSFTMAMAWKSRTTENPSIQWLRSELMAIGSLIL
jgi:DNA-binding transcriptional LysR family regulator